MATKEEKERLAKQLQEEAEPMMVAIGLEGKVVE